MDSRKAQRELSWRPKTAIDDGLRATVRWYINHREWVERARTPDSESFETRWYAGRIPSTTTAMSSVSNEQTLEISRDDLLNRRSASGAFNVIGLTGEQSLNHTPTDGLASTIGEDE